MGTITTVRLQLLAPLWTGNVDREMVGVKPAAIVGGLRWWSEAIVRGLGGYACDPTDGASRCSFDEAAFKASGDPAAGLVEVCPVCGLYGCTGWGSKVRFVIEYRPGRSPGALGDLFIDLGEAKPLAEEERWLLNRTFQVIATYGSIGGKTPLKPPQPDYGLVALPGGPPFTTSIPRAQVQKLVTTGRRAAEAAQAPATWPNLQRFFFNNQATLARPVLEELLKLSPFLAGRLSVSKKIFVFAHPPRFWGYTDSPTLLNTILQRLSAHGVAGMRTGEEVLREW
jgi:CRISPR-associated protein Cmr1